MMQARATDYWRLQSEMVLGVLEAQSVIAMRMLGMAGMWNATADETRRMVGEEPEAFGHAAMATALAMMEGKPPMRAARIGLGSVRRTARANEARLARREAGFG